MFIYHQGLSSRLDWDHSPDVDQAIPIRANHFGNVSYHKNVAALTALSLFDRRVMVIWLPIYYSDLNPLEQLWRYLKE